MFKRMNQKHYSHSGNPAEELHIDSVLKTDEPDPRKKVYRNATVEYPGFCNGIPPASHASGTRRFSILPRGLNALRCLDILGDCCSLVLAYICAYCVRFYAHIDFLALFVKGEPAIPASLHAQIYLERAVFYIPCFLGALLFLYALSGMYGSYLHLRKVPILWNIFCCNAVCGLILVLLLFIMRNYWHFRSFLPSVFIFNVFISIVVRFCIRRVTLYWHRKGRCFVRAILIGNGKLSQRFLESFHHRGISNYRLVRQLPAFHSVGDVRRLLPKWIQEDHINVLFLVSESMPHSVFDEIMVIASACNVGCVIYFPEFLILHNIFSHGDLLNGRPLVHFPRLSSSLRRNPLRNTGERLAALIALILLSPLFLIISILIRLDSRGKAFFLQNRYGLHGKPFKMYKFRTMVQNAEQMQSVLQNQNETDGALFKMHNDPRVTRIGKILRKTSLDELPQLINIVRGEMRFVGPRPLPCRDLEPYLTDWQGMRQLVPPGLTCIWQVSGRSDIGFNSMALLDLWYIYNRSFFLDLRILIRTVWCVFFSRGAY